MLEELFNPMPSKDDLDPELKDLYLNEEEYNKVSSQGVLRLNDEEQELNIEAALNRKKTKPTSLADWKAQEEKRFTSSKSNILDDSVEDSDAQDSQVEPFEAEQIEDDELFDDEDDEVDEDIESDLEEEQAVSEEDEPELKNGNTKGNLPDEDVLLEDANDLMNKEDEEYLAQITQVNVNDKRKGKNVENQKKLFESLIGLRIFSQNINKIVNKFPQEEHFDVLNKGDNELSPMFGLTQGLIELTSIGFRKGNFANILEKENDKLTSLEDRLSKASNSTELWDSFSTLQDLLLNVSEEVLNIWYRKTQVYSYKTSSKLAKAINKDFSRHIKQNVQENFSSLRKKANKKLEQHKILGKGVASLAEPDDPQIFNDLDLYEQLLKEFFVSTEEFNSNHDRFDLTMQYLSRKRQKTRKDIDTKASKNRKLRYDKHEKLISFLVPEANTCLNIGRDEIIKSIFATKAASKGIVEPLDINIL